MLRRAVEMGVEYIDTADFYGPHVANELIREALHPYPTGLVIGTKVGVVRDEWRAWNAAATPDELREQVEENLANLGLNQLDLVYLRVGGDGLLLPAQVPFAESLGALVALHRRVPYFPLAAGILGPDLDKSRIPPGMGLTDAQEHTLDRIAAQHRATRMQVALAWLLARSPATLPIPGTSKLTHLQENLAAAQLQLSPQEVQQLNSLA